jgi:c-di-GMP-binding flagellar brake protein YcgR
VLYRFQRREFFRVRTHEGATAHFAHPSNPALALSLRVLDVSVGGCALALPAEVPAIAAGSTISHVELEFDAEARFAVALQVQHVSGGFHPQARGLRLGCSFARLDGLAERSLQRFIDVTQRRAKLQSLG